MHRLHSILDTKRNNRIDIQISSHGRFRRGELKGLIRLVAMLGESIFVRVDSDGGAAQLASGAHDAGRDLAAVGGHELGEWTGRWFVGVVAGGAG